MSDINPIARPQHTTLEKLSTAKRQSVDAQSTSRSGDSVQLSDQARLLSKLKQLPDVREGLINSVQSQIEAGSYDTPERFDTAIDALLDDLAG